MSFIDSSRHSPLAALVVAVPDDEDEAGRAADDDAEEEPESPEPHQRESGKAIKKRLSAWIDNPNIARDIDPYELARLGDLVVREYEIDETSRSEWKDEAEKALKFAVQEAEPKQYPWPEASNIVYPLITSAALQFNARAYAAIIQNRNVVKGVVWGDDKGTPATQTGKIGDAPAMHPDGSPVWLVPPGQKKQRAQRIGEHMSWQLLEQMPEWEEQTDTMLTQMPIVGGAVRKTFRDPREDENKSLLVPLMNLVWNFHAASFEKAPRHTEIQEFYPHEVEEMERDDETFLPVEYGPGDNADGEDPSDSDAPRTFLEQHRRYDLDGDGYAEPLIVTVHKRTSKVVRIVVRYEEDGIILDDKTHDLKRIEPVDSYTLYRFLPNPKGGSYPVGFGHLLKPLNEAINTTLNQMFDAGHLQIAGGGFIGTSLSLHAGPTNFSIGEYKPVNNKGQAIRDSVYTIPWPGPSEVLFQLLGFLVSAGKEVASIQDILTGDAALSNTPPTTMLALIEQGVKVYTAIHKRLYRALKAEFAKLYRLNRIYLQEDQRYRVGDSWREVTPQDYRLGGGVEPIADPTMVTDMQRLGRAMVVAQAAKESPLVNPLEAVRRMLEASQIDRIDELIPDKMPPPPPPPPKEQLELQTMQSRLGQIRAQEVMQNSQAVLNLAQARAKASGPEMAWIDKQLDFMRMHIEALNTTVKAAQVDAAFHGHNVRQRTQMKQTADEARVTAHEQPLNAGPTDPAATSPGPAGPLQPAGAGTESGGIPGMASPPGHQVLPALPGAPQPQLPAGSTGPLAGGQP